MSTEKVSRPKHSHLPVPGPGRPKGVPNKLNGQVKEMILRALDQAGGVEYLARQAEENPAPFLSLLGKVLPMQVTGVDGAPLSVSVRVLFGTSADQSQ